MFHPRVFLYISNVSRYKKLKNRYYQPYFNIESADVSKRLLYSFKPLKPDFMTLINKSPDMYIIVFNLNKKFWKVWPCLDLLHIDIFGGCGWKPFQIFTLCIVFEIYFTEINFKGWTFQTKFFLGSNCSFIGINIF